MSVLDMYQSNVSCSLSEFFQLSVDDVTKVINGFAAKHCTLDSVPTWFLKNNSEIFINVITRIANLSLSTGVFPGTLKHDITGTLIKKPSLDRNTLKNYRPVSTLSFYSKLWRKLL